MDVNPFLLHSFDNIYFKIESYYQKHCRQNFILTIKIVLHFQVDGYVSKQSGTARYYVRDLNSWQYYDFGSVMKNRKMNHYIREY